MNRRDIFESIGGHAELDLTSTRIALSKTAICARNCRQAIGRTISATSERSITRASTFRSKGFARRRGRSRAFARGGSSRLFSTSFSSRSFPSRSGLRSPF